MPAMARQTASAAKMPSNMVRKRGAATLPARVASIVVNFTGTSGDRSWTLRRSVRSSVSGADAVRTRTFRDVPALPMVRRYQGGGDPDREVLVQGPIRTAEDAKKPKDRRGADEILSQLKSWIAKLPVNGPIDCVFPSA